MLDWPHILASMKDAKWRTQIFASPSRIPPPATQESSHDQETDSPPLTSKKQRSLILHA